MRLLALDISTQVGWALFKRPAAPPRLGTLRAPLAAVDNYGPRLDAFETWLHDFIPLARPEVLAFESPVFVKWSSDLATTEHTIRMLVSLAGIAELVAWRARLRCLEVHSRTAKRRLTSDNRAKKRAMQSAAVRLGFTVADDHQADAIAVALAAYDHLGAS
jgi:Holliday junction resolvasome RuvABC endonuclease subunit